MCNCSKAVTDDECRQLKKWKESGLFIIYIIKDKLIARNVPKGLSPVQIAIENDFYNEEGNLEFYHVKEHPCNQE